VRVSENPDFAADVGGEAGSQTFGLGDGPRVYVTGQVQLDTAKAASFLAGGVDGRRIARVMVLHELGHLVGLDHVADAREIMFPKGQPGVTDYGPGDLPRLAQLGAGLCVPGV
jgi:hypothetical protein